jgi:hypothetical protein
MAFAGTTGAPDDLFAANVIADAYVDALEERVRRADATVVRDHDVQGSGNASGERDDTVVRSAHTSSCGCGEVDASVAGGIRRERLDERAHDGSADGWRPLADLREPRRSRQGADDEGSTCRDEDEASASPQDPRTQRSSPGAKTAGGRREEAGVKISVRAFEMTAPTRGRDGGLGPRRRYALSVSRERSWRIALVWI